MARVTPKPNTEIMLTIPEQRALFEHLKQYEESIHVPEKSYLDPNLKSVLDKAYARFGSGTQTEEAGV